MSELVNYKASLLLLSLGGLNYGFLVWKINIIELLNDYVNKKLNYQFNTHLEKFLYFIISLAALKILYNFRQIRYQKNVALVIFHVQQ